jgi:hypothetical protein
MKSTFLTAVSAACFLIAPSLGRAAPSAPTAEVCPPDDYATIRVSKIAPGGSMAGFDKAVTDHAKWYAAHGFAKDRIVAASVLDFDDKTRTLGRSPDTVVTLHTSAHEVPKAQRDAAWDAYVAEYQANSVVQSTMRVCLPPR